jgi:hypothetical protein
MSSLEVAFHELQETLIELDLAWMCEPERSAFRFLWRDVIHHMCTAMRFLEDAIVEPSRMVPHGARDTLERAEQVLVREAFLSVVALGESLCAVRENVRAPRVVIDAVARAADHVLERLTPFVGPAETAVRAICIAGRPLEDVFEELYPAARPSANVC